MYTQVKRTCIVPIHLRTKYWAASSVVKVSGEVALCRHVALDVGICSADKGQTRAKKVCVAESHVLLESGNAVQASRTPNVAS
jgi:hypothetical protein